MTSQRPPEPAGTGSDDRVVFRPGAVRLLAAGWWVLAAVLAADVLWRGQGSSALLLVPLLAFSCAVVHALFWYPAVVVDDDAVELVNVLRRVRLPWRTVEDLDTRWALTIDSGQRRWTSWAAPSSGRRIRPVSRRETPWAEPGAEGIAGSRAPGSSAGEAAVLVGIRWQVWQDDPARGGAARATGAGAGAGGEPQVAWNAPVLAALGGTGVLALVALLSVLAG
ncbi:hypothetical protein [Aquipuribacter sp. MA13-6]|uniref:hypothetical protein n=1 Tax=unclassified Aquipuribacter TaxID=2635084 RepID=UPI003EE9A7FE